LIRRGGTVDGEEGGRPPLVGEEKRDEFLHGGMKKLEEYHLCSQKERGRSCKKTKKSFPAVRGTPDKKKRTLFSLKARGVEEHQRRFHRKRRKEEGERRKTIYQTGKRRHR